MYVCMSVCVYAGVPTYVTKCAQQYAELYAVRAKEGGRSTSSTENCLSIISYRVEGDFQDKVFFR